jgi:hypothetical protein
LKSSQEKEAEEEFLKLGIKKKLSDFSQGAPAEMRLVHNVTTEPLVRKGFSCG